jgi:hypothetical protein
MRAKEGTIRPGEVGVDDNFDGDRMPGLEKKMSILIIWGFLANVHQRE